MWQCVSRVANGEQTPFESLKQFLSHSVAYLPEREDHLCLDEHTLHFFGRSECQESSIPSHTDIFLEHGLEWEEY